MLMYNNADKDDVKSLSLPGAYNEKISSLGTALHGFTRLKSLDLSRNSLITTEGLENQQTLESLNLYYNNISSLKDLHGLRNLANLKASEFDRHSSANPERPLERLPLPRSDMIHNLAPHPSVLEDDDVAVLDLITCTGGDLKQPRGISGSTARVPDAEDYTRDELHKMFPSIAGPTRHKSDLRASSQDLRAQKDRVYVHFADDKIRPSDNPNLKYTDETNANTTISTRGHFTPNPRVTNHITTPRGSTWSHDPRYAPEDPTSDRSVNYKDDFPRTQERGQDMSVPLSARSYELSPSRRLQPSPKQSQGPLADKCMGYTVTADTSGSLDQEGLLHKLLDLVDKYWNGSKSLHSHSKFQSLAQKLLSSYSPASMERAHLTPSHDNDKLQTELKERTAEISRLRDQMSQQQTELEQLRNKLKSHEGLKGSLDGASHELASVRSRLLEFQEENSALQSKITALEVTSHGASEQEKLIGELQHRNLSLQEQVKSLSQQVQQQNINLEQLQELTNMLQESHRSLVSTNDHLLRELDEARQRHQHEVHQMHWSYDNLKKTIDWLPNSVK
ncbi:Centrosomal protein of 72 kDa [Stylophora pistillata]|uniref:Centrosomal protein of 72 kDa n=1 Tax=Stylophora pistillata TaxID=50429 RepID=A0A2B4S4D4_STYPI|nr:Centrosomal protein of 72 kDa [Stylophora pistillata]